MTKYIDAEKLKAEIGRLKENVRNMEEWQSLCEVLSFIDSLQQEQPEVGLEKEIKDTCRNYRINDYHEQELGKNDIENIARHFFELGLKAGKEESK